MYCPAHKKTMPTRSKTAGFTLAELAIVLLIIGLLLTGVVTSLSKQVELRRISDTQKTLDQIREALLGFALANGRLPCPASSASNGDEGFGIGHSASDGQCSNFFDGFVPGKVLGISPVDDQGYVIDAWNNRIRYAVASHSSSTFYFTMTDGIKTKGIDVISGVSPNLYVCQATPTSTTSCGTAPALASKVVAVLISFGLNGGLAPVGPQEAYNAATKPLPPSNPAGIYISHSPSAAPNEFDDIVAWLSPNILYSRMAAAGKLP